ncbi:MAG: lysophospholipid acyltransferase family protein [Candidatus Dormibacteria bacterium]
MLLRVCARGGLDVEGLERVPATGPLLVCSNHLSNFDPLVLGAVFPRVMHAMAKAELFDHRLLRLYLERCNCFPVRRHEPDRAALRAASIVLNSGGALVLFPEGHRSAGQGMLEFEPGVGYLARRTGATVVPCGIWGTERVLRAGGVVPHRAPIHLRVGSPWVPAGRDPVAITKEIERRVAEMLPERYRPSADRDQVDGEDQR